MARNHLDLQFSPARLPTRTPALHPAPPASPASPKATLATTHRMTNSDVFETTRAAATTSAGAGPGARALSVPIENQGMTNGCGTTSLAAVMSYFGVSRTREDVDKSIRRLDSFTAPDDIVAYAKKNGMRASLKNDATLNDIASMLDQGVPPMVLMDPDEGNNFNLHYMVATGYERDASGKVTNLTFSDPATGSSTTMKADDFAKQWSTLKLKNVSTGFNNVLISVAPKDSTAQFPKTNALSQARAQAARAIAQTAASAVNGVGKANDLAKKADDLARRVTDDLSSAASNLLDIFNSR